MLREHIPRVAPGLPPSGSSTPLSGVSAKVAMSSPVILKLLPMASWTSSQSVSISPTHLKADPVVLTLPKAVFGALLLWGHRNIELERLGIQINDPTTSPRASGVKEKEQPGETAPAATTSSSP